MIEPTLTLSERTELETRRSELLGLLGSTAVIATQSERAICTVLVRTIETLIFGRPATPLTPTHHE
jgi:hypothetical protein